MKVNCFIIYGLFIILCSCDKKRSTSEPIILENGKERILKIQKTDSILYTGKVIGLDEFIPVSISPSGKKFILVPSRGGQRILIGDFSLNSFEEINYTNLINNSKQLQVGISNVGFISDTLIAIVHDKVLTFLNIDSDRVMVTVNLPEGHYSSYTKKIIPFFTEDDTLLVSQLYSPNNSKYESETDGFYDLCPLSIYSKKRNKFLPIYLPKSSRFKNKNLGQPIVNFTHDKDTIYFNTSPDNKIYSFTLNKKNFSISEIKSYSFTYQNDSISGVEKSNLRKDLIKLTSLNPTLSQMVISNNKLLLSYSESLSFTEYIKLFDKSMSEKERADYFVSNKRSFVKSFDLNKRKVLSTTMLPKYATSISLKITDELFILNPSTAYYMNENAIPIYKIELEK